MQGTQNHSVKELQYASTAMIKDTCIQNVKQPQHNYTLDTADTQDTDTEKDERRTVYTKLEGLLNHRKEKISLY